jgi:hypothetical protein
MDDEEIRQIMFQAETCLLGNSHLHHNRIAMMLREIRESCQVSPEDVPAQLSELSKLLRPNRFEHVLANLNDD